MDINLVITRPLSDRSSAFPHRLCDFIIVTFLFFSPFPTIVAASHSLPIFFLPTLSSSFPLSSRGSMSRVTRASLLHAREEKRIKARALAAIAGQELRHASAMNIETDLDIPLPPSPRTQKMRKLSMQQFEERSVTSLEEGIFAVVDQDIWIQK